MLLWPTMKKDDRKGDNKDKNYNIWQQMSSPWRMKSGGLSGNISISVHFTDEKWRGGLEWNNGNG